MKLLKKSGILALSVLAAGQMAIAYPVSLTLEASLGMYTDSEGGTFLPAGAYYQVWWSADASYGDGLNSAGTIGLADALLGESPSGTLSTFGDYVIWSGTTPSDGVWGGASADRSNLNPALNGSTAISSGHIYVYVYKDGTPGVGDSYVRSPIYGPTTDGANPYLTTVTWGNASAPQPPPPDLVDVAPSAGVVMGTHFVVPEPGTMALFGLGVLTIAARRRRK